MRRIRSILAAIDGAPLSWTVVDLAMLLATAHRASVTLLHVYDDSLLLGARAAQAGTVVPIGPPQLGDEILQLAAAALAERGIRVRTETCDGPPGVQIVQVATAEECDVIIIGRSYRSRWYRWLHGSVCSYVVDHAPCAVLVAHPDWTSRIQPSLIRPIPDTGSRTPIPFPVGRRKTADGA